MFSLNYRQALGIVLVIAAAFFLLTLNEKHLARASTCGAKFIRADVNNTGTVNIADYVYLLAYLQSGGPAPCNLDRGDVNDDDSINIADPVYLLDYLFGGGDPPPAPFPTSDCDTSSDTVENCCSPGGGGSFTVTGVWFAIDEPEEGEDYVKWDDHSSTVQADKRKVNLRAWNYGCDHEETYIGWRINYAINDTTPGAQAAAFNDGCVKLKASFNVAANFMINGTACGDYYQDNNTLWFEGYGTVYFEFTNGSTTKYEPALVTEDDEGCWQHYHLIHPRVVVLGSADTAASYSVELTNASTLSGDYCWKLTSVIVGRNWDIIDYFWRWSGEDLVAGSYPQKSEYIKENGYSVFLSSIAWEWK
jgi:hypothetical protein